MVGSRGAAGLSVRPAGGPVIVILWLAGSLVILGAVAVVRRFAN
jgi:hypothetical protein